MAKMLESTRRTIMALAEESGFVTEVAEDGKDIYDKLITLHSPSYSSAVKIDKVTGFSASGTLKYLKVAVDPVHYHPELEDRQLGIMPAINQKTKVHLHSHSGYQGFLLGESNEEPVGKAYRVDNLDALRILLNRLSERKKSTV
jgi:hypothetical protein